MTILCPVDQSDASFRALEYAVDTAERRGERLHVVHVTDVETDVTRELLERVRELLADRDVADDPELLTDYSTWRASSKVGEDIVALVRERGYDHVVMGHHQTGRAGRLLLGSAVRKVLDADLVPVTVVPSGE